MGVKKIMNTFFSSMQEQTMAGYGGKIVNTPMGPFRWNDVIQLWENVNNGMVMNNISFQDSIIMDYAVSSGGGGENICNYSISNVEENIVIDGETGFDYDACIIPSTIRTTTNTCPIVMYLALEYISGDNDLADEFDWLYKIKYPGTSDNGKPLVVGVNYSALSPLSTKITLNANSSLGYGPILNSPPLTNFVLFGKYAGVRSVEGVFKARLINETLNEVLHEATINFDNTV